MIITAASLLLSVLAESSGKIGASRFAGMSLDPFSGDGGRAGSRDRVTDFLCATRTLFRLTLQVLAGHWIWPRFRWALLAGALETGGHTEIAQYKSDHQTGWLCLGAGIAQWLERRTRDWKVAGSNPCWNGGRIFFSRVDFLCWL